MRKLLFTCFFLLLIVSSSFAQTLYDNSTLGANIFNPGVNSLGNPKVVFDDVQVPSSVIGKSDSIFVTNVKFGIYRPANAVATTVKFYYTPKNDTATQYNTLERIPPVLLGTANLPANGASAVQFSVSIGDSINPLFKVKADTGYFYTNYSLFFLGVSFTNSGAYWRFASGGANDDVMWIYNADSTTQTYASYFGGSPKASFYTQVYGYPKAVLPITLSTFNASVVSGNVLLSWKTESESNSSYFDVEASKNGTDFYSLGKVNATGYSSTTKSYSFTHVNPSSGTYYYRLKLMDKDNSFKYSSIQKIIINNKPVQLNTFPNPVVNLIRFNWLEEGFYNYRLAGMVGKELQTGVVIKGLNELNVSNLSKGVYVLDIINSSGQVVGTQKLVKQ